MSRFQATALYLAQVILSGLGANTRPAALEQLSGFTTAVWPMYCLWEGLEPSSAEATAAPGFRVLSTVPFPPTVAGAL